MAWVEGKTPAYNKNATKVRNWLKVQFPNAGSEADFAVVVGSLTRKPQGLAIALMPIQYDSDHYKFQTPSALNAVSANMLYLSLC